MSVTRYSFDINRRRFAENMRAQMPEQATAAWLPGHINIDLAKTYVEMTGVGELWVGGAGLPLRQIFELAFPPDAISYAYVNSRGETMPMQPGDRLVDAVQFILTWGPATDGGGPVRILAGFTQSALPADDALAESTESGSLSQPVPPGARWFAGVRAVDSAGNVEESSVGPFYSVAAE